MTALLPTAMTKHGTNLYLSRFASGCMLHRTKRARETRGHAFTGFFSVVQLVLIYCLIANANSCIEKRPVFDGVASVSGCMVGAQPTAAEFLREHPGYRLAAWKCEIGKRLEKAA
jgi:hypothetical protein